MAERQQQSEPMVEVVAAYAIEASTVARVAVPADTDPDTIAIHLTEDVPVDVALCHECSHRFSNPEVVALTSFTLGGVDYEQDVETGHWVPSEGGESRG